MCCMVGEPAPTEGRGFRTAEQQGDPSLADGPRERGKSLSEHRRGLVGNRRGGGQSARCRPGQGVRELLSGMALSSAP